MALYLVGHYILQLFPLDLNNNNFAECNKNWKYPT